MVRIRFYLALAPLVLCVILGGVALGLYWLGAIVAGPQPGPK